MRNHVALVCLIAMAPATWAQPAPKGIESGLHQRASVIESDAVSSITPDQLSGYEEAPDGTKYTVLHIRKSGAEALRIHFENIRLPEGATLLVYGAESNAAWVYTRGSEESAAVAGESAFIEIQCAAECPPDMPFDIADVAVASISDLANSTTDSPQPAAAAERFSGNFRGIDVEYEVRDGLAIMEGDIILGPAHEMQPAEGGKERQKQAIGLTSNSFRWPGGKIPYAVDYAVPNQVRITDAINHWNTMLGGAIRFVPRTNESVYLRIVRGSSCSAMIGMGWTNTMYLSDACATGNVIHELGHTVGLFHEHVREDRNQHVRIRTENILSSALSQFAQMSNVSDDIGTYDFNSIMHYSAYSWTANGQITIETIPAGIPIGQRKALSTGDIAAVRRMYGYGYSVPTTTTAPTPAPAPAPTPAATPVSVTISANPVSEQIVVDGTSYKGSVTLQWTVGSTHTVSAPNRPASNGSSATFVRWSDGGAATHKVTAPSTATLYRADFSIMYSVTAGVSNAGGTVSLSPLAPSGYYPANSSLTLSATPASGYCFGGWSGLIAGTPPKTTLTVTKPYAVTANFAAASFSLSQQLVYVAAVPSTYSVNVTATAGCSWTAQSQTPWIHVSTATRSGSGTVSYTVDANTSGVNRIGGIVIGDRAFYVLQYK